MTVTEYYEGRTQTVGDKNPRATIPYLVTDVADEDAAITAANAAIPAYKTIDGKRLKLTDMSLEMMVEPAGDVQGVWRAEARYEKSDLTDEGSDPTVSFTTIGGTAHITQSLETRGSYGPQAADHKGTIGFDGEKAQGVDIETGTLQFTWTERKTDAEMSPTYLGTLYSMSPGVNDEDVLTPRGNFKAGELLFLGVSGTQREDSTWDLTFSFRAAPNEEDLPIGDITVDEKRGQDYIWFEHATEVDDAAGPGEDQSVPVLRPIAAYVERVYQEIDFDDLELEGWT